MTIICGSCSLFEKERKDLSHRFATHSNYIKKNSCVKTNAENPESNLGRVKFD